MALMASGAAEANIQIYPAQGIFGLDQPCRKSADLIEKPMVHLFHVILAKPFLRPLSVIRLHETFKINLSLICPIKL